MAPSGVHPTPTPTFANRSLGTRHLVKRRLDPEVAIRSPPNALKQHFDLRASNSTACDIFLEPSSGSRSHHPPEPPHFSSTASHAVRATAYPPPSTTPSFFTAPSRPPKYHTSKLAQPPISACNVTGVLKQGCPTADRVFPLLDSLGVVAGSVGWQDIPRLGEIALCWAGHVSSVGIQCAGWVDEAYVADLG